MSKLNRLKSVQNKHAFAKLLGISPVKLTHCLYIEKIETQYHQFSIKKKSGGYRIINAPSDTLKNILRFNL